MTAPSLAQALPVFAQGLLLCFGLIVAIGAQNAFILRQGLRREHVVPVVLFCAVVDALLISAGVLGMAQALGESPTLARLLALAGAAFLVWYGWAALRRVAHASQLQATDGGAGLSRGAVLAQAAAFTFLNPHVYLDTVMLMAASAPSSRRACAAGSWRAPAPPAWCGSAAWALAHAGWRRCSASPAPGRCWTP